MTGLNIFGDFNIKNIDGRACHNEIPGKKDMYCTYAQIEFSPVTFVCEQKVVIYAIEMAQGILCN